MSRLIHSKEGAERALQISAVQVFVYVEGGVDRVYLDKILAIGLSSTGKKYQVLTAKEVCGTGGKRPLVELFKQRRRLGRLSGDAFGKKYVSLFFFDKDCDDFFKKKLRSDFVFYTRTYDVEGDLFWFGDVSKAISDACYLTSEQVNQIFGEKERWVSSSVLRWKEWVALCIAAFSYGVDVGVTYSRVSSINGNNYHDDSDLDRCKSFMDEIARASGFDREIVIGKFDSSIRVVERSVSRGEPLRYFKGKWILAVLEKYLSASSVVPDAYRKSIADRVLLALVSQVGADGRCRCSAQHQFYVRETVQKYLV